MRVLVTGARGTLGRELVAALGANHDVVAADLGEFDITDAAATRDAIRAAAPHVVVHAAAFTDVDGAESRLEAAFRVNGIGTKHVVLAANEVGARVVALSTDYVFDGRAERPYVESDPARPTGVYGRSKWMGETFVRDLASEWAVVRTQALYGRTGPSFVRAILARVGKGEPLRVVRDQTVSPTRATDLAVAIVAIVEAGGRGVYHASSGGECTWFDFARAILEETGSPDHPIEPISSAELARPAPRPAYSVLRNLHLELTIGDTLPHWREALREHLATGEGGA
jgi:dTDP-4-dehydrorhamnose reductase